MEFTWGFETLSYTFLYVVHFMQEHGITFNGTFYSFFNIEIAALIAGFVLSRLPIWGDTDAHTIGDDD